MSIDLSKEKRNESLGEILVVGVGNRLLGDEGIGPHIVDNLLQLPMPPHVSILDCGCDLLNLVSYLNRPQKIIVVDAICAGGKPGEIHKFDFKELEITQAKTCSAHQVQMTDAIELLKQVCPCLTDCEITVIGIEPKAIELSADLSKEVRESIADLTRLLLAEISLPPFFQQGEERGVASIDTIARSL